MEVGDQMLRPNPELPEDERQLQEFDERLRTVQDRLSHLRREVEIAEAQESGLLAGLTATREAIGARSELAKAAETATMR